MSLAAPVLPSSAAGDPSRVRRVLMTTDTVGGVWTYAIDLCGALAREGVQIVLATMGAAPSAEQCAQAGTIPGLSLETSTFKLEWMNDASADVAGAGRWLLDLERRHRPDVIHLNGYAHAALPWKAPVLVVAHSCVHTWWRAVRGGTPDETFSEYTRQVRAGLAAADLLVAPTRAFLAAFQAEHDRLPPTEVLPNARDPRGFAPGPKQRFFLSVGRLWDEAKNARALAEIAPHLPWPVKLAGDAASPDGRAVSLPNVERLGRCTPQVVAQLMAAAPVYVLPARYEPFGLSVLEAALSGCALVLGDIPSLRENWDGAACWVAPDDPRQLRDVLGALADDPPRVRALAHAAQERARKFELGLTARRYLDLYHALMRPPAVTWPDSHSSFA